jgi:hypothetical protein
MMVSVLAIRPKVSEFKSKTRRPEYISLEAGNPTFSTASYHDSRLFSQANKNIISRTVASDSRFIVNIVK